MRNVIPPVDPNLLEDMKKRNFFKKDIGSTGKRMSERLRSYLKWSKIYYPGRSLGKYLKYIKE